MAKRFTWWLLPLCGILSACPFESTVPVEAGPVEAVDSSLLGYWYGIIKDGSDYFGIEALEISAQSDSVYAITRYGKAIRGDMVMPDTALFTAFTTYIGDQRFMSVEGWVNIEELEKKKRVVRKQKVFYASAFSARNDTLEVKTVTESFSVKKYFSNPAEFKQALTEKIRMGQSVYDDQYSLKYRKIPKPDRIFQAP